MQTVLDKDTLTRPVVEVALDVLGQPSYDRESDTYLKLIRPREYEALAGAIREDIECGNSVIATAPFLQEFNDAAWITRVKAMSAAVNAVTTFVWVHCDPDTMHTYLRHRGAARDTVKLADWSRYLAVIDLDFRPLVSHTLIDNSASSTPLQEQAGSLLKSITHAAG